jgi:hypothetical protein
VYVSIHNPTGYGIIIMNDVPINFSLHTYPASDLRFRQTTLVPDFLRLGSGLYFSLPNIASTMYPAPFLNSLLWEL